MSQRILLRVNLKKLPINRKKIEKELGVNHINLQAECERGKNDDMIVSDSKHEN